YRPNEIEVVAALCSIAVHRGDEKLPRTVCDEADCVLDRIDPGRAPASVGENFPAIVAPAGVDRCHHALAAESLGYLRDDLGPGDGRRVNRHLVCPGQ